MVQLTAEQQARRRIKKAMEAGKTITPRGRNKVLLAEFAQNIKEHTTTATSAAAKTVNEHTTSQIAPLASGIAEQLKTAKDELEARKKAKISKNVFFCLLK